MIEWTTFHSQRPSHEVSRLQIECRSKWHSTSMLFDEDGVARTYAKGVSKSVLARFE